MIVYLLIIIFFICIFYNKNEHFIDYKKVYGSNKEQQIYKGMYKCRYYEDIRLN